MNGRDRSSFGRCHPQNSRCQFLYLFQNNIAYQLDYLKYLIAYESRKLAVMARGVANLMASLLSSLDPTWHHSKVLSLVPEKPILSRKLKSVRKCCLKPIFLSGVFPKLFFHFFSFFGSVHHLMKHHTTACM